MRRLRSVSKCVSLGYPYHPYCLRSGSGNRPVPQRLLVMEKSGQEIMDALPGPFRQIVSRPPRAAEDIAPGRLGSKQPGWYRGIIRNIAQVTSDEGAAITNLTNANINLTTQVSDHSNHMSTKGAAMLTMKK